MTRVLVVDDEPQILRALRINLRARQYDVVTAATGAQALEQAATHPPDLVILDLGLPDMPGIDVIGGLRGWTAVPIIVLSGRADSTDKVDALDAGADDYVTKPFGMDELLARMRAATRRSPVAEAPPRIQLGGLTIDLAAKRVIRPGGPPASGTSGGGEEDEAGAHVGRLRVGNANDVPGGDAGIGEAGAGGGTLREADGGTAGLHGRDVTVRGADEAGDDRMSVAGDAALRGAAGGTADDGAGFGAGGARGTGGDQGGGHGAVGRGAGVAGGTGDDAMDLGAGGGYGTGADQGHGHGAGGHPADLTGGGVGEVGGGGGGSRARSEGTGVVSGAGAQADGDVRLTPTEWHLLEVLLRNPGKLLSHRQLLNDVWGPGYDNAGGNLRLYMAQLRRKLEPDPARPRWLITEPGMGYRYQPSAPDDQPPPG